MNYKRIYDMLVENAKNREVEGYTEMHHIIPLCMGGDNTNENLVRLTAREHYLAHALLYKHYRTTKLAHAWFSMVRRDPNQKRFFTARQYESARLAHVGALKKSMKGSGNNFYGRTHSEETKRKIGEANRGESRSPEEVAKWVERVAKKPKSKEHRQKIGRRGMIMLKNIHTGECIRIDKELKCQYDSSVWMNPFAVKKLRKNNENQIN